MKTIMLTAICISFVVFIFTRRRGHQVPQKQIPEALLEYWTRSNPNHWRENTFDQRFVPTVFHKEDRCSTRESPDTPTLRIMVFLEEGARREPGQAFTFVR